MDSEGNVYQRTKDDLVFDYRHTNISAPFILTATLELEQDDPNTIAHRTREIWMYKRNTQPLSTKKLRLHLQESKGVKRRRPDRSGRPQRHDVEALKSRPNMPTSLSPIRGAPPMMSWGW